MSPFQSTCAHREPEHHRAIIERGKGTSCMSSTEHSWSSGRIGPCHGPDPGSIPGECIPFYKTYISFAKSKLATSMSDSDSLYSLAQDIKRVWWDASVEGGTRTSCCPPRQCLAQAHTTLFLWPSANFHGRGKWLCILKSICLAPCLATSARKNSRPIFLSSQERFLKRGL